MSAAGSEQVSLADLKVCGVIDNLAPYAALPAHSPGGTSKQRQPDPTNLSSLTTYETEAITASRPHARLPPGGVQAGGHVHTPVGRHQELPQGSSTYFHTTVRPRG